MGSKQPTPIPEHLKGKPKPLSPAPPPPRSDFDIAYRRDVEEFAVRVESLCANLLAGESMSMLKCRVQDLRNEARTFRCVPRVPGKSE